MASRTQKDSSGTVTANENYVYDGSNLALVLNQDGQVTERELYGPAVDQILASETVAPVTSGTQAAGTIAWMLVDNQGTVHDVLRASGGSGVQIIVEHIAYDSFGQISGAVSSSGGSDGSSGGYYIDGMADLPRFTYAGRQFDSATGLYYNRARWYDPANGVWISQDPIGFNAGQANLEEYVGNSPTNYRDPLGMAPTPYTRSPAATPYTDNPAATPYANIPGKGPLPAWNPNSPTGVNGVDFYAPGYPVGITIDSGGGTSWPSNPQSPANPFHGNSSWLDNYSNWFQHHVPGGRSWATTVGSAIPSSVANHSDNTILAGTVAVSIPVGFGLLFGGEAVLGIGTAGGWLGGAAEGGAAGGEGFSLGSFGGDGATAGLRAGVSSEGSLSGAIASLLQRIRAAQNGIANLQRMIADGELDPALGRQLLNDAQGYLAWLQQQLANYSVLPGA